MKENVAIFSEIYHITNNVESINEYFEIGDIYNLWFEHRVWVKDQRTVIKVALKSKPYDWVIGLYNSATILLSYKGYKKILINPKVCRKDLDDVTDFEIRNTYSFFDSEHKKDYELFHNLYPHSILFPQMKGLKLSDIKDTIKEILGISQSDMDY